jgi:hypothetical protein
LGKAGRGRRARPDEQGGERYKGKMG